MGSREEADEGRKARAVGTEGGVGRVKKCCLRSIDGVSQ